MGHSRSTIRPEVRKRVPRCAFNPPRRATHGQHALFILRNTYPRARLRRRWRPRNHAGTIAAPPPPPTLNAQTLINDNDDFVFDNDDHRSLVDWDNHFVFEDDDFRSLLDWDRAWIAPDPMIESVTKFLLDGSEFGFESKWRIEVVVVVVVEVVILLHFVIHLLELLR